MIITLALILDQSSLIIEKDHKTLLYWKCSRSSRETSVRYHLSKPNSSTGITHIVTTEKGFNSPWKAPILSKEKNALRVLAIFPAIAFVGDRFGVHHISRHLKAVSWFQGYRARDILRGTPMCVYDINSHLLAFNWRKFSVKKSLMIAACLSLEWGSHVRLQRSQWVPDTFYSHPLISFL